MARGSGWRSSSVFSSGPGSAETAAASVISTEGPKPGEQASWYVVVGLGIAMPISDSVVFPMRVEAPSATTATTIAQAA